MSRMYDRSEQLFAEAKTLIPGGVNSPVRAFKSVGRNPVFIERAEGAYLYDVDGNKYVDYVGSWGPMIVGHAHPEVSEALKAAIDRGTSYGAPTELESRLAKLILEAFPAMDMVRMVNSGTEATMSALRLARGYTGRSKIVKFEGCYHGHADSLLIKAGSGALTLGVPTSPGVPANIANNTITAPYNDLETLKAIFQEAGDDIAAIIIEGVPGNMGVVPPAPGYLQGVRELTRQYGALMIVDEVMSGFRVDFGGAQTLYGVEPDLTCLGKIIGGGLPVGAYGGKAEIMEKVSPAGPIYQAGTLSGNPLAMTAGIITLEILKRPGTYAALDEKAAYLADGLAKAAEKAGVPVWTNRVGSMLTGFFTDRPVVDFASACTSDTAAFGTYFRAMLDRGVYLACSQFEAAFLSLAMTKEDLDFTIAAAEEAFQVVAAERAKA
ncbi:glutamate-1-semialdehyde-2,1-aminomutase heml [Heliomicrobium modesticaldum Ice1]|uniref:Glutamate-1-semialdehyde 2,1-aminomutase n=2 Tax=Heliomicrobium modesticaldum TaxID=35701 RepID=GSA_HELMI|nr:RecName: Full=Glutamate-1-semialdehyde 2,1-aminomutase; Short=GSA; AltName: Full=Glutamate-1-semialdehyde aminotransferase; Short=GSA-AT [Heliomicrobium modesticaldum Ice1]ABZ84530.1 glutamate-1-semialdehyde-2,1-aminomutase heml [Heliomicrobium modesticaldum Ice1]